MTGHSDTTPLDDPADDERLLELAKAYQTELESGRRPDRSDYLGRHPDLRSAAAACLDGLDLLYQGAKNLTGPPSRTLLDTGLMPGTRIGEFQIVREVGRGGMGVVYEAQQASLNRRVAIKVLPAAFAADQTRLRRFAVEAEATAAAAHPHIVPVYGVGEDRGLNYYVMRFIDGVPLDTLAVGARTGDGTGTGPKTPLGAVHDLDTLAVGARTGTSAGTGPKTPVGPVHELITLAASDRRAYHRAIARLGSDIARALDHAHQSGVIHRDVKPANLLLDRTAHVWVTDFGLAQFADGAAVTRTGGTIGTLRYMSPEQAAGDRRWLDHRTDIYSLAATLYELLTGQPAFPAEQPGVLLRQIANEGPAPPRAVDPSVPEDLETIILKAMQKSPRERYATAADMAGDLERFLAGQAVTARRPSAWDQVKRWAGRHPTSVAAALVALVIGVIASSTTIALVAAQKSKTDLAYKAERDRADEAERRFRQSKNLSDLVLQISEEEIGSDSPFQGPRRRLLKAALENYKTLYADGHDPAMQDELNKLLERVERLLADQAESRALKQTDLLGRSDVRADLEITQKQVEQILALVNRREPGPRGPEARRPGPPDTTARNSLLHLLSEPQRKRLDQVYLQNLWVFAFQEPEVVEKLQLTVAQRQKIKSIVGDGFGAFGPPLRGQGGPGGPGGGPGGPGGPRGGPGDRPDGLGPGRGGGGGPPGRNGGPPPKDRPGVPGKGGPPRTSGPPQFDAEAMGKVMNLVLNELTPEQRKTWEGMTGEPFVPATR